MDISEGGQCSRADEVHEYYQKSDGKMHFHNQVEQLLTLKNLEMGAFSKSKSRRCEKKRHYFKPLYKRVFIFLGIDTALVSPFFTRYVSQFKTILGGVREGIYSVTFIVMLMLLVMYLYSIAGIILFRENDPYHFRSLEISMLTMLTVSLFDDWGGVLFINYYGCDIYPTDVYTNNPAEDDQSLGGVIYCKSPNGQPTLAVFFFVTYIFITSFFVLSLVIGNIGSAMQLSSTHIRKVFAQRMLIWQQKDASTFIKRYRADGSTKVLSRNSRELVREMRLAFDGEYIFKPKRYKSENLKQYCVNSCLKFCSFCSVVADSDWFNNVMSFAIIFSGIVAGMETVVKDGDTSIMAQIVSPSNTALQYIFTIEVIVKIAAESTQPWMYFSDSWNALDFVIVMLTWLSDQLGFNVIFLRLIRLFRVMKLIKTLPRLQAIVQSVLNSFTSIVYVVIMFGVYILVVAPIGIHLFGRNNPFHFGSLMSSVVTLFQVVTFDNFIQVMSINLYGCDVYPMEDSGIVGWNEKYCNEPEAQFVNAALFFTINVIIGGFVGTTLFIGIMIASMVHAEEELQRRNTLYAKVRLITRTHGISKPIIDKYQQIFDFLDITHASRIGRVELKYAFQLTRSSITDEELDRLFKCIDLDGSQTIDFSEFVYFMMEVHFIKFKMKKAIFKLERLVHILHTRLKGEHYEIEHERRVSDPHTSESRSGGSPPDDSHSAGSQRSGPLIQRGISRGLSLMSIEEEEEDEDKLESDLKVRRTQIESEVRPSTPTIKRVTDQSLAERASMMTSFLFKGFRSNSVTPINGSKLISRLSMRKDRTKFRPSIITPYIGASKQSINMGACTSEDKVKSVEKEHGFAFIKAHANIKSVRQFVRDKFAAHGIKVTQEGELPTYSDEDSQNTVIRQYAELGEFASKNLFVHRVHSGIRKEFYKAFRCTWDDVLLAGKLLNCFEAMKAFDFDADTLATAWLRAQERGNVIKLGRRIYCGLIDDIDGEGSVYVINGFYAGMINGYWNEGSGVYYFCVEWNIAPKSGNTPFTWNDFNNLIGVTDPSRPRGSERISSGNNAESIRYSIYKNWKHLGLSSEPNILENCIHASQSAFEAFVGRNIWLNNETSNDPFGKYLTLAKLPTQTIMYWCMNPEVGLNGQAFSMFEMMENLGWEECLSSLLKFYNERHPFLEDASEGSVCNLVEHQEEISSPSSDDHPSTRDHGGTPNRSFRRTSTVGVPPAASSVTGNGQGTSRRVARNTLIMKLKSNTHDYSGWTASDDSAPALV